MIHDEVVDLVSALGAKANRTAAETEAKEMYQNLYRNECETTKTLRARIKELEAERN